MSILTARLELIPLTPPFLRAGVAGDWDEASRVLGAQVPPDVPDFGSVMRLRLAQIEEDPAVQPWLLRAIVRSRTRDMIGHIGFHEPPGGKHLQAWSPQAAEFGYEVFPAFQRNGFAREAAMALMEWAHRVHRVPAFIVSIAPSNAASQHLAAQLGFRRIGSQMDEIDGEEDVLERVVTPAENPVGP